MHFIPTIDSFYAILILPNGEVSFDLKLQECLPRELPSLISDVPKGSFYRTPKSDLVVVRPSGTVGKHGIIALIRLFARFIHAFSVKA